MPFAVPSLTNMPPLCSDLLQPAYNTAIKNAASTITLWYKRGVQWEDKWIGNFDPVLTPKPDYGLQVGSKLSRIAVVG